MALQSIRNTGKNVQTIMFTENELILEVEVELYKQEGALDHIETRLLSVFDTYKNHYVERTDFTHEQIDQFENTAIGYCFE